MSIGKRIIRFILSPFPIRAVAKRKLTSVGIARKHSRGNVRLQLGKIMFNDEYKAFRARVSQYEF